MNKDNIPDGKSLSADSGAFVVRDETSISGQTSKDRNSHLLSGSHQLPRHFVLEKCVTASITRPQVAPIPKEERKRALIRAKFYSECLMQGINPDDANAAALDADILFKKWWVDTKFIQNEQHERSKVAKRQKLDDSDRTGDNVNYGQDLSESTSGTLHWEKDATTGADTASTKYLERRIPLSRRNHQIPDLKSTLIQLLRRNKGDTTSSDFHSLINTLGEFYREQGADQRWVAGDISTICYLDGTWLALSKSEFTGSIGRNENGDILFPLGRIAFDMFRPTGLLCSMQGAFNIISPWDPDKEKTRPVIYPASLIKSSTLSGQAPLRKYE
jgi:hypothetical protein